MNLRLCGCALACLAALSSAQTPAEILEKAREKLLRVTHNLSRYTCVETVNREYFAPPEVRTGHLMTEDTTGACPAILPESRGTNPVTTDRLRLEVAVSEGREIHAWPGAREFDLRPLEEIVDGPISTGGFGNYLVEIFENPATNIIYVGKTESNGRTLFEYAYRTPLAGSHYFIAKVRRRTGHGGSLEIDPATLDLVRLRIATDPVAADTGLCVSRTHLEYHRVTIGSGDLVLPEQGTVEMIQPGSSISRAVTTFAGCHEYQAESTIRFEDDSESGAGPAKPSDTQTTLPAKIHFTLRTLAPIDFDSAAAGDRITARVAHSSDRKQLPDGSIVTARLTSVRHFVNQNRYLLTISPRSAAVGNATVRLAAVLERHVSRVSQGVGGFKSRGQELAIPPPTRALEGSFSFPGSMHIVRAGFESSWITVVP